MNLHLTHHTWGQKNVRAPDPHPWLPGRAEERVQEAEDLNKQSEALRSNALEHGYDVDRNGHYVPIHDLTQLLFFFVLLVVFLLLLVV